MSPYGGLGGDMPPDLMGGSGSGMTSYGGFPPSAGAYPLAPGGAPPGQGGAFSAPSPAVSDPYAPGGAFSGAMATTGSPGPAPFGGAYGGAKALYGRNALRGSRLPGQPPKGFPRWALIALGVLGAGLLILFLMQAMRTETAPTPPPVAPAPVPACPPAPHCPPSAPARPEEFILKISKDDGPLKVQVSADVSGVIRTSEDGHGGGRGGENGGQAGGGDRRRPEGRHADDRHSGGGGGGGSGTEPTPPVIIVNEARAARPQPSPPDLWELAFAGDSASPLSPRTGDTNMVFTRVGAAF